MHDHKKELIEVKHRVSIFDLETNYSRDLNSEIDLPREVVSEINLQPYNEKSNLDEDNHHNRHNRHKRPLKTEVQIKTNKISRLLRVFLNWSETCDINCYLKSLEYKSIGGRILWLLILLASTFFTCYLIALSIFSYLNYDVVTQIKIETEAQTNFPAVTICDVNAFITSTAQNFFYTMATVNNISGYYYPMNVTTLMKMAATNPSYGDNNRKNLGFAFWQILSCTYNGQNCLGDLTWYYTFDYGNCFQFNINQTNLALAQKPGETYGLALVIYHYDDNWGNTCWDNGMIAFVHNSSYKPVASDGVKIKPGDNSYIAVSRTFTRKQPRPYSVCIDLTQYSSKYFDLIIEQNRTYRQADCFELCFQERVIETCECYDLRFLDINKNSTAPCLNMTQWNCITNEYYKYDYTQCALLYCPLECESMSYGMSVSTLENPSYHWYLDIGSPDGSYDQYKSEWINFNVFYPTLSYTAISETPKVLLSDLFAQIGGSLGMFVSFSVFSLFEFLEVFILLVHALIFD